MRIGIIASLAASAVLGLAALGVAHFSVARPAQAAPVVNLIPARTVPVVVAAGALNYGTRLDAGHLRLAHLPSEAAPEGAFSSVQAVLDQPGGAPVVVAPIAAREVVLAAKLSGPGARSSLSAEIADGKRAYSIRLSDVTGVGGHVLPGDYVDVIMSRQINQQEGEPRIVSALVLQNVRVLGIDLNADPASTKAAVPTNCTLEVTVEDAQKLALAGQAGLLSLALRRLGATDVAPVAAVMTSSGAPPPRIRIKAGRPAAPASSQIVVTQGDVTKTQSVASEARTGGAS